MQQVKDESVRTNRNHLQAREQQAGALGLQMLRLQRPCPSVGWVGGLEGQGIARALGVQLQSTPRSAPGWAESPHSPPLGSSGREHMAEGGSPASLWATNCGCACQSLVVPLPLLHNHFPPWFLAFSGKASSSSTWRLHSCALPGAARAACPPGAPLLIFVRLYLLPP